MATNGGITVHWDGGDNTFDPSQTVSLGRDPACTIVLHQSSVSRRHAELRHGDQGWVLVDLDSTQGTHRDGAKIATLALDGPTSIVLGNPTSGERVELTPAQVDRTEAVMPSASPTELPADLQGERPGGELRAEQLAGATVVTGQTLNISCAGETRTIAPGQTLVIGRDADCDLVSANPSVSRRHAKVEGQGEGWVLEDLGSSGGTYADGRKVTRVPLAGTMAIWLGDPDTGERIVVVTSGEHKLTASKRLERASRGRAALIAGAVVLVAILGVAAVLFALNRGGGGSSSNDELARATVKVIVNQGSGSGTVVDAKKGLILTNAHVVRPQAPGQALELQMPASQLAPNPDKIDVAVAPGLDKAAEPKFQAEVVAAHGYLDLAVIRLTKTTAGALVEPADLRGLGEVPLGDSDSVKTGDEIRAVGYPGIAGSAAATLTKGVASGGVQDDRLSSNRAYLNVDADINPGNSGGLAVDSGGRLIGVPTLLSTDQKTLSKANRLRAANFAKPLIAAAREGKTYDSPYVQPLTGREDLKRLDFVAPVSTKGFGLSCSNAEVRAPRVGDQSVALAFDYEGFTKNKHQDVLVAVIDPRTRKPLGAATTGAQFPFRWLDSGCATVTIPLTKPLAAGSYGVAALVGPNYDQPIIDPARRASGFAAMFVARP